MTRVFLAVLFILVGCVEPTYKLVPQPIIIEKPVIREVIVPTFTLPKMMSPIDDWKKTSGWGPRSDLKNEPFGGGGSIHFALDMIPKDTTKIHALIHAALPGKVIFVFPAWRQNKTYGACLAIQSDTGLRTADGEVVWQYHFYAHMSDIWVEKGEMVGQHDNLGRMGNTGMSEGYHLHFEVSFDPMDFLPKE